jgi:hypothetical protein
VDNRRPELTKRQKEIARLKKQQEKIDRRNQRHREREQRLASGLPAEASEASIDDDPDLAGIVPGPQRPLEE